jgi:hypothetical protein
MKANIMREATKNYKEVACAFFFFIKHRKKKKLFNKLIYLNYNKMFVFLILFKLILLKKIIFSISG